MSLLSDTTPFNGITGPRLLSPQKPTPFTAKDVADSFVESQRLDGKSMGVAFTEFTLATGAERAEVRLLSDSRVELSSAIAEDPLKALKSAFSGLQVRHLIRTSEGRIRVGKSLADAIKDGYTSAQPKNHAFVFTTDMFRRALGEKDITDEQLNSVLYARKDVIAVREGTWVLLPNWLERTAQVQFLESAEEGGA